MEFLANDVKGDLVEADPEARLAVWEAVCTAADKLSGSCSVYVSSEPESSGKVVQGMRVPKVKTWQLVEALCLLSVLFKADKIISREVCNILGKTGPIHFVEAGKDRYLWAQATLKGEKSFLGSRPDFLITEDSNVPTPKTTQRIIECKSGNNIGTQLIRAEFGKAYDLKVLSYQILSYVTPDIRIINGAKGLGLDLTSLGFDTDMREELLEHPENLLYYVANTLAASKNEKRLAKMLQSTADQVGGKYLST